MSTLILDQFTDTSGTRLGAHTVAPTDTPATSWTERDGSDWQIQSNAAKLNSNGGSTFENKVDCDPGTADVTATVDVITSGTGSTLAGILANYGGAGAGNNGWVLALRSDVGQVILYKMISGGVTSNAVDSASFTVLSGHTYALKLVTSGDTITGYVDGVQYVTTTGSPRDYKANTRAGLFVYSGFATDVAWDNFQVADGTGGGATLTVPAAGVAVAAVAPSVSLGAVALTVPAATVTAQAVAPGVALGAVALAVPAASVALAAAAPGVSAGAVLTVPAAGVAVAAVAPVVSLGAVTLTAPAAVVSLTAVVPTPTAAGVANVTVPAASVTPAAFAPSASGGVVVVAPLVADVIHFAFTQADAVNFAYTQADAVDFVRVP